MMHTHVLLTCGFLCFAPLCFAASTGGVCAGSTREGDEKKWEEDKTNKYFHLEVVTKHCGFATTPTYVTSLNGGDGEDVSNPLGESTILSASKEKFTVQVEKGKLTKEAMKSYKVNWMATGADMSVAGQNVCGGTKVGGTWKQHKNDKRYYMDVNTEWCGFRGEPPIYLATLQGGTTISKVRGVAEIYNRDSKQFRVYLYKVNNNQAFDAIQQNDVSSWNIFWIGQGSGNQSRQSAPCTGSTVEGSTKWKFDTTSKKASMSIDTTTCGFPQTPIYIYSLETQRITFWKTYGVGQIFTPKKNSFDVKIQTPSGTTLNHVKSTWKWKIAWMATNKSVSAGAPCGPIDNVGKLLKKKKELEKALKKEQKNIVITINNVQTLYEKYVWKGLRLKRKIALDDYFNKNNIKGITITKKNVYRLYMEYFWSEKELKELAELKVYSDTTEGKKIMTGIKITRFNVHRMYLKYIWSTKLLKLKTEVTKILKKFGITGVIVTKENVKQLYYELVYTWQEENKKREVEAEFKRLKITHIKVTKQNVNLLHKTYVWTVRELVKLHELEYFWKSHGVTGVIITKQNLYQLYHQYILTGVALKHELELEKYFEYHKITNVIITRWNVRKLYRMYILKGRALRKKKEVLVFMKKWGMTSVVITLKNVHKLYYEYVLRGDALRKKQELVAYMLSVGMTPIPITMSNVYRLYKEYMLSMKALRKMRIVIAYLESHHIKTTTVTEKTVHYLYKKYIWSEKQMKIKKLLEHWPLSKYMPGTVITKKNLKKLVKKFWAWKKTHRFTKKKVLILQRWLERQPGMIQITVNTSNFESLYDKLLVWWKSWRSRGFSERYLQLIVDLENWPDRPTGVITKKNFWDFWSKYRESSHYKWDHSTEKVLVWTAKEEKMMKEVTKWWTTIGEKTRTLTRFDLVVEYMRMWEWKRNQSRGDKTKWTFMERRWKKRVEAWYKETNQSVILTRANIRMEYRRMWMRIKHEMQLAKWTFEANKWTAAELEREASKWSGKEWRMKAEVEAWWEKTSQAGVKLTRENVRIEHKKMWAWRREQWKYQWNRKELRMKALVEVWLKETNQVGVKVTKKNIKTVYAKMWKWKKEKRWKKKEWTNALTWTAKELFMKSEIEQWWKLTHQVGMTITRFNVKGIYKMMWRWRREKGWSEFNKTSGGGGNGGNGGGDKKGGEMSKKEKWYKTEIETWMQETQQKQVTITRYNVRKWYKKMWEWKWEKRRKDRMEWKINSWSPKEVRWKKEILVWWAKEHTKTLTITRENILHWYQEMRKWQKVNEWTATEKEYKKDLLKWWADQKIKPPVKLTRSNVRIWYVKMWDAKRTGGKGGLSGKLLRMKMEIEKYWKDNYINRKSTLDKTNIYDEYLRMWKKRRGDFTSREQRYRTELLAWYAKTGRTKVSLTRKNIIKEYEKMWKWKIVHTWSRREAKYKVAVESWWKETGQAGVRLTRENVMKEYQKMWAWKRAERKARMEKSWTKKEQKWRLLVKAWWKKTHQTGIVLTRDNILSEMEKMWEWQREEQGGKGSLISGSKSWRYEHSWTELQVTYREEVKSWWKSTSQVGIVLTPSNILSEYRKMWEWKRQAKIARSVTTWTEIEKRYREELKAFWKETSQAGYEVTKANVFLLYIQMMDWRREHHWVSGRGIGAISIRETQGWTAREKRYRQELMLWWKEQGLVGVVLTRDNVRGEYHKMWEWRREHKWAKMLNAWSEREIKQKAEIEAWRKETGKIGVEITRFNVRTEYMKMWDARREAKLAEKSKTWTERELKYKTEIKAWWIEIKFKGFPLTRENVKREYERMWTWRRNQRASKMKVTRSTTKKTYKKKKTQTTVKTR